jgi:imidazolonepropionase-like amidohydrolase
LRKAREIRAAHFEVVQKAKELGVKIAGGTDFSRPPLIPHGDNALEFEMFVKVGFTPLEAIMAGTKGSAQAMHMENEIGTLEKGKYADLIFVAGDPLTDITCL